MFCDTVLVKKLSSTIEHIEKSMNMYKEKHSKIKNSVTIQGISE